MRLIGKSMAMFDSFRGENGFTFYPNHESPNTIDKPLVYVTYFCVLVAIATLLATFGVRGKEKWFCAIRASYSVAVGSIILACIVSHSWKEGHVAVQSSPYVYRADLQFKGQVGLKIGLHSANVTMEGTYRGYSKLHHVHYVESLAWADFGEERDSYKPMLHRGLPEPILRVMDFLTINEGGMKWGHAFHTAGQVTCALLWTAFAFWVLTNVLLFSVIIYGAYMFFLAGFSMLMACVAYHASQNDYPLYMVYGDDILELSYGWSFWLTLVTGACTTAMGAGLILMDHFLPDSLAEFFHIEKPITEEVSEESITAPKSASFNTAHRSSNQLFPSGHGMGERRDSIFLEPERRRGSLNESLFKKVVIGSSLESSPFVNKAFEGDHCTKINPIFVGDQVFDYSEEELKLAEMEKVCERGPFHKKDHKASLATMKELSDNHANERKSTSFTKSAVSKLKQDAANSSLQSSPLASLPNLSRPRSGSDGMALTRPPPMDVRRSSVIIDVDPVPSTSQSEKDENILLKKSKSKGNVNTTNVPETSMSEEDNGFPNQFEVQVETHNSTSSETKDTQPLPSSASSNGDSNDSQSCGSGYESESKIQRSDEVKDTNIPEVGIASPSLSTAPEIVIHIDSS